MIASRLAEDIRGTRIPLFADFTSSMAELSGNEPLVLMATWAIEALLINVIARIMRSDFIIRFGIYFY
jgi:hypothetical protein